MNRTHFELKFGVETISEARVTALKAIASFLEVSEAAAPALVDLELKVALAHQEKDLELSSTYVVTAFANVKNSVAKPI